MSWFIYFAFLAGQFVFYSGVPKTVQAENINVFSLAILAIAAGVFTEHAYYQLTIIAEKILRLKNENETPDKVNLDHTQ